MINKYVASFIHSLFHLTLISSSFLLGFSSRSRSFVQNIQQNENDYRMRRIICKIIVMGKNSQSFSFCPHLSSQFSQLILNTHILCDFDAELLLLHPNQSIFAFLFLPSTDHRKIIILCV